jgi:hypothetical protein
VVQSGTKKEDLNTHLHLQHDLNPEILILLKHSLELLLSHVLVMPACYL